MLSCLAPTPIAPHTGFVFTAWPFGWPWLDFLVVFGLGLALGLGHCAAGAR